MSVSEETSVPFIAESIRKVPVVSSFPSTLTPFSRKPVHSPESWRLRSNKLISFAYLCSLIFALIGRRCVLNRYCRSTQRLTGRLGRGDLGGSRLLFHIRVGAPR